MFKSKIEVREFAVTTATKIHGCGTPSHDVIAKAKEIESYIIGNAILPEVYNGIEEAGSVIVDAIEALSRVASADDKSESEDK